MFPECIALGGGGLESEGGAFQRPLEALGSYAQPLQVSEGLLEILEKGICS